ncbi:MAG: hypothetical protein MJE77_24725 [Proteobacteria bacterium]|nr:hypothetical protein [Pseudomonadota bacterium]
MDRDLRRALAIDLITLLAAMTSDAELLECWRKGDHASGRILFERYYDAVDRFFANKVSF